MPFSVRLYTKSTHDDVDTDVSTAPDLYQGIVSCRFYEKK